MGADWPLGFMPHRNVWQAFRRLYHRFFKGVHGISRRLVKSPEDFTNHTRLYVKFDLDLIQRLKY